MYSALIVGLGQIGMGYDLTLAPDQFVYSHARALSLHPEFKLVGGVDPDRAKRRDFQKNYKVPAFEQLEEALGQHQVDLVVIATPTRTHFHTMKLILENALPKAILCEKPLSFRHQESREMLSVCRTKKVSLFVNYMRRSEPGAIEVRCRIDNAEIASPVKGVAWYSKGFLHNGSHLFNLLQFWLGEVRDFAVIRVGRDLEEGDAEPDLQVEFEKGSVMFLAVKEEQFSHNSIELIAANGRLRYEYGGRNIEWTSKSTDKNLKNYVFLDSNSEKITSKLNQYQTCVLQELASALKGDTAHLCKGEEAHVTLKTMHSILAKR